jgi:branched-chain amino acid transport system ATP-binding protein
MLELRDITVRYGGLTALAGVSMSFEPGLVTGVIGPNGAGKTTLFNVASGFEAPSAGSVLFGGMDITRFRPERRARLCLARTFQRMELFSTLTVRENVLVAARQHRFGRHPNADPELACDAVLGRLGLEDVADSNAGRLSTGTGRRVELARALVTDPRVLLLDEPASGQDDVETRAFDDILQSLAAEGTAIVLVEHDLSLVMRVCGRIYVLDRGQVIAEGTPLEVQADRHVQDAYLGASA